MPPTSIIAVHGLGAHPELTWTVPDLAVLERDRRDVTSADSRSGLESAIPGRFNWLREYLPFDFPLARIMLFGHNADWFMDAPTVSSHETARKLLQDITEKRAGLKVHSPCVISMIMLLLTCFKNRRILFIGHSYGGIILKKVDLFSRSLIYHASSSANTQPSRHWFKRSYPIDIKISRTLPAALCS